MLIEDLKQMIREVDSEITKEELCEDKVWLHFLKGQRTGLKMALSKVKEKNE